jgi:hypothetical protein
MPDSNVPALVPGFHIVPFHRFSAFQSAMARAALQVIGSSFDLPHLDLHARTIDDAARFLIPLLRHLSEDVPLPMVLGPGIISCMEVTSLAFFFKWRCTVRM